MICCCLVISDRCARHCCLDTREQLTSIFEMEVAQSSTENLLLPASCIPDSRWQRDSKNQRTLELIAVEWSRERI
jgi:hypothetical protein